MKSIPSVLPAVPKHCPGGDAEIAVKNSSPSPVTVITVKLSCIHIGLGPDISHTPFDFDGYLTNTMGRILLAYTSACPHIRPMSNTFAYISSSLRIHLLTLTN